MNRKLSIIVPILMAGLIGCGDTTVVDTSTLDDRPEATDKDNASKADQWNWANNPDRFQVDLNYTLDELPTAGRSEHIPWPATYWPTYEDSINVRWNKPELSPAEKYDVAFNNWEPTEEFMALKPYSSSNCSDKSWDQSYYDNLGPAANYVSRQKGNWKAHDGVDNDGDGEIDECGDRDGVETWFGLCHAWAPAALLEQEPQHKVTHNGVTFEVSDIKALLIMEYDRPQAYMIGGRCNDKEVERDEQGRITDDECRDTNAGTWHVVMANFLGIMHRPIAEDRTFDYQVWNQPVIEWKVNSMEDIDEKSAIEALGLDTAEHTKYPYNDKAVRWVKCNATSYYITESDVAKVPFTDVISQYTRQDIYNYILEIGADGKINGGEWIGSSITNHPDFLWLPTGTRGGNPHMDLDIVRMLLEKSRAPETGIEDPTTGEVKVYANEFTFDIPDNDAAGVSSTISVLDEFTVGTFEVEVDIAHTFVGDLTVVVRKDGSESVLHAEAGGSTDNIRRTFTVTDMGGTAAAGNWELWVKDSAAQDVGKINSWKLKLATDGDTTPDEGGTLTVDSSTEVAIPDDDATGATSTIEVTERHTINAVKVTVLIEHSYIGALTVEMKHGPVKHTLHNQEGGSDTQISKTFDVTAFNGSLTEGTWELIAVDGDAYGDTGAIKSWEIEFLY